MSAPNTPAKKYRVTLEYHSKVTVDDIEADSPEQAEELAQDQVDGNQISANATLWEAKARETS